MPELVAATHTPFDAAGGLMLSAVPRQAAHLAAAGIDGVFIGGTTGESLSLTVAERMALADAWVAPAREHRLRLMIHVGASAVADAAALAAQADRLRVDAVSAMAPSFFKPATVADLAASLAEIAAAAAGTPFYYYDISPLTGVTLRSSELLERHGDQIPTLEGVKHSSPDIVDFERCVAAGGGRFRIYWGCDEALMAGLALGATGGIGSTYNFAAPLARGVIEAFEAGDLSRARALQIRTVRLVDVLARHAYLRASKAVMAMQGVDVGSMRLPLRPLEPGGGDAIRSDLVAAGFGDLVVPPTPGGPPRGGHTATVPA
ncbi:MAG: dihydrodipicolinate synthase family protein [Planctomycetaceae bacterium]